MQRLPNRWLPIFFWDLNAHVLRRAQEHHVHGDYIVLPNSVAQMVLSCNVWMDGGDRIQSINVADRAKLHLPAAVLDYRTSYEPEGQYEQYYRDTLVDGVLNRYKR